MKIISDFATVYQDEIPNYRPSDASISSLEDISRRVRVPSHRFWAHELHKKFDSLTALPKGWDGYNGRPVSFNCAQFAANLVENLYVEGVPTPQLVPGSDGTVQIEWHVNGYDVEIDVLAPYQVVATRFDHLSDSEQEIEVQTDFTELATWILALGEARDEVQFESSRFHRRPIASFHATISSTSRCA